MIIGGEFGSPAEIFANVNGIKFELVGNSEEEIKAWLGWQDQVDESQRKSVAYYRKRL